MFKLSRGVFFQTRRCESGMEKTFWALTHHWMWQRGCVTRSQLSLNLVQISNKTITKRSSSQWSFVGWDFCVIGHFKNIFYFVWKKNKHFARCALKCPGRPKPAQLWPGTCGCFHPIVKTDAAVADGEECSGVFLPLLPSSLVLPMQSTKIFDLLVLEA